MPARPPYNRPARECGQRDTGGTRCGHYRTSPNEVTSCSMIDPLRRKDFAYGVVVTFFDEAL